MSTYRADGTPIECQNCVLLEKKLADTCKPRLSSDAIIGIIIASLVGAFLITVVICVYRYNVQALTVPKDTDSCLDSVVIITASNTIKQCDKGAALSTEQLPSNQALVKCTCPASTKDK